MSTERTGEPARAGDAIFVTPKRSRKLQRLLQGLLALASTSGSLNVRTSLRRWESAGWRSAHHKEQHQHCRPGRKGETSDLRSHLGGCLLTLQGLRAEIESAAAEYRRNAESRIQRARSEARRAELSESGKRISAAIRAHEQGMSAAM